uniref:histidine kinase n=1 Tax=Eubacterium cellulosolvens (strain ATCC 43171 / JCM 9499 / 6) TaxID=633697 RepID=I5AXQ6_EUBC6
MTFRNYLKDHIALILMNGIILLMILIFLRAFRVEVSAVFVVVCLYVAAMILSLLWDFIRKKKFYDHLINSMQELDKKYLVSEMISSPGFYEGEIWTEVLADCDKSMAEQVAEYRRQNQLFREYIETWVHEAKIPIASMRLMCHNHPDLDARMIAQLKQLDDDINNVLFYARSENAQKDYIIKETSLKKVFHEVAMNNRVILQLMDAEIAARDLDILVMTDEKWLEFMLGQIISNSIKYCDAERKLKLEIWAEEISDKVMLHFRDNGIGIPASDLPRVFDKTFTGENGRKGAASTGMGLYIVRNLCDKLGHGINISSQESEYTEVTLTFSRNDFYKMRH